MSERSEDLQLFIDAAFVAYDRHVRDSDGRRSILEIFGMLERPGDERTELGSRLPVCERLADALAVDSDEPILLKMLDRFRSIEPRLIWTTRKKHDGTAGANFAEGHANAMIAGPGGIEERKDLWLGVTLMAPNVRYPDHFHAPEETYLVLSDGKFRQGERDWFAPGIGGTFYNLPNVKHAMRSMDKPLLAFWALLV
ncbi:dimethylsulfoniopropionate lyase [Rhizobium sp. LEGMi135b]